MTDASDPLLRGSDDAINREQREYWGAEGPRQYQDFGDVNEALLAPFGQAMLDAAQLQPGERVLDVGCGHGTSTFEAAERVAPSGRVAGIDISAEMLEPARQQFASAGVDNVEFVQGDAQVYPFEPGSFDVVLSRFGVMFFENPQAAFANLARALRPSGRLVFVCPQDPLNSEWIALAFGAAAAALGRAPELGPPGCPGTFALADGDRLHQVLGGAGFHQVALEAVTRPVRLGHTIDDTVEFILSLRESQQLFASASPETLKAAASALRDAFSPYVSSSGVVTDATAWLVLAHS